MLQIANELELQAVGFLSFYAISVVSPMHPHLLKAPRKPNRKKIQKNISALTTITK